MIKKNVDPAGLSRSFRKLIENRERKGLTLRPPKKLLQLLHLVREHAAAIAFRPISFANKEYLEERVGELHCLGREMELMLPGLKPQWQTVSIHIRRLLKNISAQHGKRDFSRIVWVCDQTRYRNFWKETATYIPAYNGTIIKKKYDRVIVVTGPGIGLGDEISCLEFIRSLKAVLPGADFDFYGFYPGFWNAVEPESTIHSLVGKPTKPFDCVDDIVKERKADKTLLVFINFSGLRFHLAFCLDKVRPDIVEIAVGKGVMWFAPADGSPIQVARAMDELSPCNYIAMRKLAGKLLGPVNNDGFRQKQPARGFDKDVFQIIINPFTSKQIFLGPQDWALIIKKAINLKDRKQVSVSVLPGMSEQSKDYAMQIVDEAKTDGIDNFNIRILENNGSLYPDHAFQTVYQSMCRSDLLIGIDTYTAHLAAALSVPSVALCYYRNVAFWPDISNSTWIELRHDVNIITEWTSLILILSGGLKNRGAATIKKKLRAEEFIRLESNLSSANSKTIPERIDKSLENYNAAWNLLPANCRNLINQLDYNYAWPKINGWLGDCLPDENASAWLLDIIDRSHFRKLIQMIANF